MKEERSSQHFIIINDKDACVPPVSGCLPLRLPYGLGKPDGAVRGPSGTNTAHELGHSEISGLVRRRPR
ncbi:hypothetical protein QQF64_025158 [Cirrhinus molitorella]|uniref:Uncharacterized protein n=1 Tax=Cirrhinus molitorella TaxID=172907 RepID=A0ABR3NPL2_9TELE